MKMPKMLGLSDGNALPTVCSSCQAEHPAHQLNDIQDFENRLIAGCSVPAGQCPRCAGLCFLKEAGSPRPLSATPPPLLEGYKKNFATLQNAAMDGNLSLVSSIRFADNKPVALVAAVNRVTDEGQPVYQLVPLAVMIEGNPFELFKDPTL